jgi:integrase
MAGSIIPKGKNKYLLRVFVGRGGDGKRRYRSELFHGGKREASDRLAEMLTAKSQGKLTVKPSETVGEFLDTWLDTTAKPSVRPRTLAEYTDTLRLYVRPHLGGAKLARLAPADVRGMLQALREQGLAPRTVRKAHEVLRNALEQAVSDRLISDNPARSRLVKKALPQKVKNPPETLPAADVPALLDVAKDERLGALFALLALTGLRPSEALALRWSDLSGSTLSVTRAFVYKAGLDEHFAPPKSDTSRRAVALPSVVVGLLREHRKRQAAERLAAGPAWNDQDLIFANEHGGPVRQDHLRSPWKRIKKAAELPAKLTIYGLRHSAATLMLEQGIALKVVSDVLGHSTIALTADTYSHVNAEMKRHAADALDVLARQ